MTELSKPAKHHTYAPSADWAAYRARASMYQSIRQFFAQREVIEVETPLLSHSGVTDVHLASVSASVQTDSGQAQTLYLHTSPEFAMKRLVAHFKQPMFQICKVFRDGELGRKHNIEFTMLEWYRPDWSLAALQAELTALLSTLWGEPLEPEVLSYRQAFLQRIDLDPMRATVSELQAAAHRLGLMVRLGEDRLAWLDVLFSHFVEPTLGCDGPLYLTEFPAEMASLARVVNDADGFPVAARFELYIDGLELANAYDELANPEEQKQRFEGDNAQRLEQGLPVIPIDTRLLAALGDFPVCAGIAVGLDRVLMALSGKRRIDQVIGITTLMA